MQKKYGWMKRGQYFFKEEKMLKTAFIRKKRAPIVPVGTMGANKAFAFLASATSLLDAQRHKAIVLLRNATRLPKAKKAKYLAWRSQKFTFDFWIGIRPILCVQMPVS